MGLTETEYTGIDRRKCTSCESVMFTIIEFPNFPFPKQETFQRDITKTQDICAYDITVYDIMYVIIYYMTCVLCYTIFV